MQETKIGILKTSLYFNKINYANFCLLYYSIWFVVKTSFFPILSRNPLIITICFKHSHVFSVLINFIKTNIFKFQYIYYSSISICEHSVSSWSACMNSECMEILITIITIKKIATSPQQTVLSHVSQNWTLLFLRVMSPTSIPITTPDRWAV